MFSDLPDVNTMNDGADSLILCFYPTSLLMNLYHRLLLNHIYKKIEQGHSVMCSWDELVNGTRNVLQMLLDENMV